MLRHGTGSVARAASYVLDEKDHMNIVRPHVEVLSGDPHIFAKIADSSPFKHKYTSAVIAFAEEDQPTDIEIKDVLKQFEALAFSGLEPDQYHMTAVLHHEPNGSKHIHILVPRLELRSGKAMNIAPPGLFQKHFHTLQDKLNSEYGWADPKDPDRARFTKKGYELYLQSALKKVEKNRGNYKTFIENLYVGLLSISLKQLETNQNEFLFSEILVHNRDDFMQFVLTNKLASEVAKIRENQFSLIPTFGKNLFIFKEEYMKDNLTSENAQNHFENVSKLLSKFEKQIANVETMSSEQLIRFQKILECLVQNFEIEQKKLCKELDRQEQLTTDNVMHLLQHQKNETQILIRGLKSYRAELKQNISNIQMTLSSHLNEIDQIMQKHLQQSKAQLQHTIKDNQNLIKAQIQDNTQSITLLLEDQKNQLQQQVDQALTQSITYNPKLILKTFILMLLGMGLLNILVILPSTYYLTQPILTKNETEILTDEDGTRYRAITSSKWIDCNTLNLSKKKVHPTEPNIHLTFPCFVEK
ncbi:relaxase/mobilization nuclease domain-containing protein [Acinetobacter junii]|nr:relaxase/mobilization nuclease domain-containing protein [Acinetobacter junii]